MLNTDTEGVASVISHDRVTISCSDAGAHNIFLCDADFGLQVLGTWVRDRGLFSMEKAVHEVTGKVAAIYGLQERGTLEVTSPRPFGAFCLCLGVIHFYPVLLRKCGPRVLSQAREMWTAGGQLGGPAAVRPGDHQQHADGARGRPARRRLPAHAALRGGLWHLYALRKAFSCLDGKPAARTVLYARRPLGLVGLTRRRRVRAGVNGLRVIENDVLVDGVGEAARPGAVMRQFNEPL